MSGKTSYSGRFTVIRDAVVTVFGPESHLSCHRDVLGGSVCIWGTRIPVWSLECWRRLGWDDTRIQDAYPQLSREDLAAAWGYVETHREEIDRAIQENEEES